MEFQQVETQASLSSANNQIEKLLKEIETYKNKKD